MNWPPPPPYLEAAVPPPLPNSQPSSVDAHPPPSSPASFYRTQDFTHFPPTAQPQYSIQANVTPSYTQYHSGNDGLPLAGPNSVDCYPSMPLAYPGYDDRVIASSSSQGQFLDPNSASVVAQNGFQGHNLTGYPQGITMASYIASAELTTTTTTSNQFAKGHIKKYPKRQKKPKVVQSAFCEVCKIVCCSQDDLQKHRLGKKHQKNVEESSQSTVEQSAFCEICSINCSGHESLQEHRLGKKHRKNLELNGGGGGEIVATPIIGPPENPNKEISVSKKNMVNSEKVVDVEAKRRRVIEGGAAADSVMVCSICNVVCNSDIVFSDHLAGKSHAAMLKKQAAKSLLDAS